MTKRTIIKATAIILTLPLFFSCAKDSMEESNPIVEEQGITLAESEATRLSVKNLMESSQNISLTDFVSEAKKLKNIKDAIIEDSLVYLTTTAGGSICVDLFGSSLRKQDYEEYSVDTCGTFIQNYIDAIEEQYKDSISDGVEYDPIEGDSIEVNYGDEEDVIITRATLHHRKILNKRRIAIWEPWDEFANYDISPFISIVQNSQLSYSIINNVSPSAFSSFSQYDLVYIGSHGAKDGSILLPIKYESLYCSKYNYTKDGKTYVNESAMAKDGISYLYTTDYFGLVKKDKIALKLDKRFLNNHLPNLSNTIICTSMCYAGRSNSQLLQSARSKGCPEFYGADEPVEGSGIGPMSFFRNFLVLFSNGSSAKLAYELGKRLMVKTNSKYNYNRYGNTNVTYFNPYITGVREVKDKSAILGVKFQFSLDIPGSVNSETANQYGIYLENLGKYIPLSNSNVVNQATTTLYNSVCAYYANVKVDDLTPNTNYRYRSYVIVGNIVTFSGTAESFKTEASLCPDNNHPHAIDLGLPSGTKWACCNVGASSPEGYGGYYAWGETSEKGTYLWTNYSYYVRQSGWQYIGEDICGSSYDVANVKWGDKWSMPNRIEFQELISNCSLKWVSYMNVNGLLIVGANNNRLFLPGSGGYGHTGGYDDNKGDFYGFGTSCHYWSSSADLDVGTHYPGKDYKYWGYYAYELESIREKATVRGMTRSFGFTIRPVAK